MLLTRARRLLSARSRGLRVDCGGAPGRGRRRGAGLERGFRRTRRSRSAPLCQWRTRAPSSWCVVDTALERTHVGSPWGGSSCGWSPAFLRAVVLPEPALPQTQPSEKPSAGHAGKPRSSSSRPRTDPAKPGTSDSQRGAAHAHRRRKRLSQCGVNEHRVLDSDAGVVGLCLWS
jgi:hypothetical protein